jgi:hypothetical protein
LPRREFRGGPAPPSGDEIYYTKNHEICPGALGSGARLLPIDDFGKGPSGGCSRRGVCAQPRSPATLGPARSGGQPQAASTACLTRLAGEVAHDRDGRSEREPVSDPVLSQLHRRLLE